MMPEEIEKSPNDSKQYRFVSLAYMGPTFERCIAVMLNE